MGDRFMNLLERYIFGRMVVSSLGSFGAILGVVWVSQAVTRIDFATGTGQSILSFLSLLVAITPQLIGLVLPFGILIGVVQVLNTLNSNAEMPVMASAGVSRWSIAKPALLLGLLAALFVFVSAHVIEPLSNKAKRDIVTQARADFLTTLISPGQFRRLDQNMVIYIDSKEAGNRLKGLMLSDTRDPKTELVYYAQTAYATKLEDEDVLFMESGQVQSKDREDGTLSIIQFDSYVVSLAEFTAAGGQPTYKIIERSTPALLNLDSEDAYLKQRALEANAEVHRRFSDWLYPILFAFVGLVVAGQPTTSRETQISALGLAFLAGLGYKAVAYYIYGESSDTRVLVPLLYAIPLAAIALSGWLYHTGRSVGVPVWLSGPVKSLIKALDSRKRLDETPGEVT